MKVKWGHFQYLLLNFGPRCGALDSESAWHQESNIFSPTMVALCDPFWENLPKPADIFSDLFIKA